MDDLFADDTAVTPKNAATTPLAERLRPRRLEEVVGHDVILGPGTALGAALAAGRLPSLILWGPPGCGKTTLAACLARAVDAAFLPYSAVEVGVKELKAVMAEAGRLRRHGGRASVLFLDEIHRFNKAQQDALLPAVEAGDVVLVGATTENPSFEINAALLSRCRVVVLDPLSEDDLVTLLRRSVGHPDGIDPVGLEVQEEALRRLARRSGGDARFALGNLELACRHARAKAATDETAVVDAAIVDAVLAEAMLTHDKSGDRHFDLISALHKSLRNSDAQAGLYWLARMLEAGEDPLYVGRRLVRFASEDIGLADPRALDQALAAVEAVRQIGLPEAALALAQAAVYLAQAPKSNALYRGYAAAARAVREGALDPVPPHLRNAPTPLMEELGHGAGYRYAHDDPEGVAPMSCLPDSMSDAVFYRPSDRGFEAEAAERLRRAWKLAHRNAPSEPNNEPSEPKGRP